METEDDLLQKHRKERKELQGIKLIILDDKSFQERLSANHSAK